MRTLAFAAVLASSFLAAGDAAAEAIACPAEIVVSATVAAPADWTPVDEKTTARLERAELFLMHPSEKGSLVPDETEEGKGRQSDVWKLVHGAGDEFWVACRYAGVDLFLARKLPPETSSCKATYETLPSGQRLKLDGVDCR